MTNGEDAVAAFKGGCNCSQSVMAGFAREIGIDIDTAIRVASGFGGGMGRKQEVCGAVSGAIMVLGLLFGGGEKDCNGKKEITYEKVRRFIDLFDEEHGAHACKELLSGCSLVTEAGVRRFREEKMRKRCEVYVKSACELVNKMRR